MAKITGNTVGIPNPITDYAQNDPTKADYIKNRPLYLTNFFKEIPEGKTIDDLSGDACTGCYILYEPEYMGNIGLLYVGFGVYVEEEMATTCTWQTRYIQDGKGIAKIEKRNDADGYWTSWEDVYVSKNYVESEIDKSEGKTSYLTEFFKTIPQETREQHNYIDTMTYENGYAGVYLIGNPYIDHVRGCDMLYVCIGLHPKKDLETTYQMKFSLFRGYDDGGNLLPDRFHFKQRYQEINSQGDFDGWSEWEELFTGDEIVYPELMGGVVDLDYNPDSANAQSGIAVAQAISQIPTGGSDDKRFPVEPQLDITIEEAVNRIDITQIGDILLSDSNYTSMKILIKNAVLETAGPNVAISTYLNGHHNWSIGNKGQIATPTTFTNATSTQYWGGYINLVEGLFIGQNSSSSEETWRKPLEMQSNCYSVHDFKIITQVTLQVGGALDSTIPIGTRIKIWFK